MASKDELRAAAGVDDDSSLTKAELEETVDAQVAAGPFVEGAGFERHGTPIKGVQALEDNDIPDAGR